MENNNENKQENKPAVKPERTPIIPESAEIILRGVDKGTGMARLCEICNIAPEEVLAFGDEENDLPLISFAGTSYVMENAPENVRRTAQRIAPRNTDCGVARIVELYLNEKRMGGA